MRVTVTHLGTATLLLEIGPFRIVTDPVLGPAGKTYAVLGVGRYRQLESAVVPPDLGAVDAVLLSHDQHGDNLDDAGRDLAREAGALLTTTAAARRWPGPKPAVGLRPWQSHELRASDGSRLRVTATPARHAPWLLRPLAGPVIGFVLSWAESDQVIWISGDTVFFDGVRQVAAQFDVGWAFLHLGRATLAPTWPAHFTFTAAEAARTSGLLGEAMILPIHYQGWSHFREDRDDVAHEFARQGLTSRLRWLPVGSPTVIG